MKPIFLNAFTVLGMATLGAPQPVNAGFKEGPGFKESTKDLMLFGQLPHQVASPKKRELKKNLLPRAKRLTFIDADCSEYADGRIQASVKALMGFNKHVRALKANNAQAYACEYEANDKPILNDADLIAHKIEALNYADTILENAAEVVKEGGMQHVGAVTADVPGYVLKQTDFLNAWGDAEGQERFETLRFVLHRLNHTVHAPNVYVALAEGMVDLLDDYKTVLENKLQALEIEDTQTPPFRLSETHAGAVNLLTP